MELGLPGPCGSRHQLGYWRSAQKERLVGREIHCSSGWEPAPSMIRGGPDVSRETRDLLLRKLSPRELHEETLQVAGRYARDSARLA